MSLRLNDGVEGGQGNAQNPPNARAPDLDTVRNEAMSAVVKLAQRKEHSAKSQPGAHAERGHDALQTLHDPRGMLEAIELYRIAMTIGKDPTVANWKGLAEELTGDLDAATRTYQGLAQMIGDQGGAAPWMRTYDGVAAAALARLGKKRAAAGPTKTAPIASVVQVEVPAEIHAEDMHASMKALLHAFSAPARADGLQLEALMGVAESTSKQTPTLRDAAASVHAAPPSLAPMEAAEFDAACHQAQRFGDVLAQGDFAAAHAMLSTALRRTLSVERLRILVTEMMMDEGITLARVSVTENNWPGRQAGERAWAYIALEGRACREAATVIVAREAEHLVICDLEWGRP